MKDRRAWSNAFQVRKDHHGQPKLFYPPKPPAIAEGEGDTFYGINSLNKFVSNRPNLRLCRKQYFKLKIGMNI